MPGYDGTGPLGYGAFTGRGLGYCAGVVPAGRFAGRGRGRGRGLGLGFGTMAGFGTNPYAAPVAEKEILSNRVSGLKQELDALQKRIEEIESTSSE